LLPFLTYLLRPCHFIASLQPEAPYIACAMQIFEWHHGFPSRISQVLQFILLVCISAIPILSPRTYMEVWGALECIHIARTGCRSWKVNRIFALWALISSSSVIQVKYPTLWHPIHHRNRCHRLKRRTRSSRPIGNWRKVQILKELYVPCYKPEKGYQGGL
jgi:hypothetical protein